jgi:1-acyl-sn-glycerol-3-phosphate acyltransferase
MEQATPAIPAAKNPLGDMLIYRLLMLPALWNMFDRVWVQVHGRLPRTSEGPLLCYLNHTAWWDGYLVALFHHTHLNSRFSAYVMMEEPQLRLFRFFTWCGAFSIAPRNPRETARSLAYISRLLRERPQRVLYIFPQGSITPNDRRPLHLLPGMTRIVEQVGKATLCPVALRYEFRGEQRPEAFIRYGPLHTAHAPLERTALHHELEARLTASADALRDAIIANDTSAFAVLLRGRPGIDRLFSPLARAASRISSE